MKKKLLDLKKTGSRDPDPAIKEVSNREVAVIGLALKLADYEDTGSFWKDVMYGCDRIGPFPPQRLEDTDSLLGFLANQMNGKADGAGSNYREMAYLDRIDTFDSRFFRLSPKDASAIDPAQRLFLETAWRAVEDSGYGGDRLRGERVGVFVGSVASGQYADIVSRVQPESFETIFAGNVPSNIVGRISYLLDWHGPAAVIDTACSSALVAVHTACRSIRNGECRMALAGTAKIVLTPVDVGQKAEISSADGRTRTFDNNSDGTGAGEGIIAVLLKPLHQAVKDNDHIYAVIKGSAVNQDGNAAGITVPNAEAQADVIRGAWKDAAIDPATIGYIEAHGTGTRLGDPIEIDGLTRAFSAFPDSDREQARAIGSVKANFGHLDNAAGLLGLVKAILCLQNRQIPPLVHFKEPNARIRFETSPVYVPEGLTDWRPPSPSGESPRRCGVSSFGLSGINCHMVVEEAPPPKTNETGDPVHGPHLLLISGKDAGALERYIDAYRFFLAARPEKDLNDLCATAATGRGHYNYRLALLFKDRGELDGQLDSLGREGIADCREQGIYYHGFTVVPEDAPSPGDDGVTYKEIKALGDQAKQLLTGIQRDLEGLAGLYVSGAEMDWIDFYTSGSHGFQKMSIPTYPLEKRRCWFQLPAPSTAPTANASRYSRVSDVDQAFLNFRLAETPDQVIYSVTLDPATSWLLKNHRVMGEPTLVGTAYYQ
ncbi:MAG: polyketide synthase, partial [bacterium]|nr:polyketide synthase [bacterium]